MLCCRDYDERVVFSFPHKIQPEYYGGNRSVSIEDIVLEHFSALPKSGINASKKSCPRHAVFHYFCQMTENKILTQLPHTENV